MNITQVPGSFNKNPLALKFNWYDYLLFAGMIVASIVISVYYGCFGNKQFTAKEYLIGGKTMTMLPVAISLIAGHVSDFAIMAVPADVYQFGATYWLSAISMLMVPFITIYIYLPVFLSLDIISVYEYLERRFDRRVRLLASVFNSLCNILVASLILYLPSLAFSAGSGINVDIISTTVCLICVFYTTTGGFKTVVWTDVLQGFMLTGTMVTILVAGTISAGGVARVWKASIKSGRLDVFDFDINPTKRETVWCFVLGYTVHCVSLATLGQAYVQKYMSVATFRESAWAAFLFGVGVSCIITFSTLIGLVMYAKYADCDPVLNKAIERHDQLAAYFVMDLSEDVPGLAGIFIAGIFAATLSSLSTIVNAVAAVTYEDFIKTYSKNRTPSTYLKLIAVVAGAVIISLTFLLSRFHGTWPLFLSCAAAGYGPITGVFTTGILFPKTNSTGAFYGTVIGIIATIILIGPAKYYQLQGFILHEKKPISVDGCSFNVTLQKNDFLVDEDYQPPFVFRISFYYYTMIGFLVSGIVSLVISYISNDHTPVDKNLISPICRRFIPKMKQHINYHKVDTDFTTSQLE